MEKKDSILTDILPDQAIFALDIGTRSIIGMVGVPDGDRIHVVAIEREEHTKRAMIDGQIEDIDQVAKIAGLVKDKLEKKLGCRLTKVCVAAAGRALRTETVTFEMELPKAQRVDAEAVSRLEAGAISEAENIFMEKEGKESDRQFYLVGYTVCKYYLDNYIISNLIDHHGRVLKADIIATFLPTEVVESLYASMHKIGLEVASLTLEPIAAINAAIPQNIRLLNLAMVDIGAGTSDIAVCRDGSVTGYTMAILAGDEITETIMREYLVDYNTAEEIKSEIDSVEQMRFTDILGFEQSITREAIFESIKQASSRLCEEISAKIIEANGGVPSAVFLAGGGSRLSGLREGIVEYLQIDPKRVAIAGNNFKINAFSEEYDLNNPEYATPLGIVISAGLNMINDSFRVILNGRPAKLFRSGTFTVMDILMMNGYNYQDMIGRSGQNLVINVNGQRRIFYGQKAEPSLLKLNGKEAQLSEPVNAGDRIEFIPARHGVNASAKLSDAAEPDSGKKVLLNGQEAVGEVPLKSGDSVTVENLQAEIYEDIETDDINESYSETEYASQNYFQEDFIQENYNEADYSQANSVKAGNTQTDYGEPNSIKAEDNEPDSYKMDDSGSDSSKADYTEANSPKEGYTAAESLKATHPQQDYDIRTDDTKGAYISDGHKEKWDPKPSDSKEDFSSSKSKPETGFYEEARPNRPGSMNGSQVKIPEGNGFEVKKEMPLFQPSASGFQGHALEAAPSPSKAYLDRQNQIQNQNQPTPSVSPRQEAASRNLAASKGQYQYSEPDSEKGSRQYKEENWPERREPGSVSRQDVTKPRHTGENPSIISDSKDFQPVCPKPRPNASAYQPSYRPWEANLDQAGQRLDLRFENQKLAQTHVQGIRPVPPEMTSVKPELELEGKVIFYLNEKPLMLSAKPEGRRYRLMDLLEYSGLDFKKVTGPVVLEVNGENGYFQQELKDRDHIRIYEKE